MLDQKLTAGSASQKICFQSKQDLHLKRLSCSRNRGTATRGCDRDLLDNLFFFQSVSYP
jgi:hypothetical protein